MNSPNNRAKKVMILACAEFDTPTIRPMTTNSMTSNPDIVCVWRA